VTISINPTFTSCPTSLTPDGELVLVQLDCGFTANPVTADNCSVRTKIDLGISWSNYCKFSSSLEINNLGTQVFEFELQLLLIPYQMQLETLLYIRQL
jgi:hypothetical protein